MPFYIIVRSVEGLDGWNGRDLVSLHVMWESACRSCSTCSSGGRSDYFSMPRETYQARLRTSHGRRRGLKVPWPVRARAEASPSIVIRSSTRHRPVSRTAARQRGCCRHHIARHRNQPI